MLSTADVIGVVKFVVIFTSTVSAPEKLISATLSVALSKKLMKLVTALGSAAAPPLLFIDPDLSRISDITSGLRRAVALAETFSVW